MQTPAYYILLVPILMFRELFPELGTYLSRQVPNNPTIASPLKTNTLSHSQCAMLHRDNINV